MSRSRTIKPPGRTTTKPAQTVSGAGLALLQATFQKALLDGDATILASLTESSKESPSVLLGVYQHAYRSRLIEILKNEYPVLTRTLGDGAMTALAHAYIDAHPSRHANARWVGQRLPEFMHTTMAPGLAELAVLERGLNDVFDAVDAPSLTLADLTVLMPEDWPGVVFSPHVVTRRLTMTTNAAEAWRADNAGAVKPPIAALAEPEALIVYRQDMTARFRPMDYAEAMMWDEMAKGLAFGGLCEMLAMQSGDNDAALRAASYLKGWIDEGLLAAPD